MQGVLHREMRFSANKCTLVTHSWTHAFARASRHTKMLAYASEENLKHGSLPPSSVAINPGWDTTEKCTHPRIDFFSVGAPVPPKGNLGGVPAKSAPPENDGAHPVREGEGGTGVTVELSISHSTWEQTVRMWHFLQPFGWLLTEYKLIFASRNLYTEILSVNLKIAGFATTPWCQSGHF